MSDVYLSGGFHTNWQHIVKTEAPEHTYFDPSQFATIQEVPQRYVARDVQKIRKCDILFAFMETSNPSGVGLAGEVGLAHARDKMVILVLPPGLDHFKDYHFDFVKQLADVHFHELNPAIEYLRTYA